VLTKQAKYFHFRADELILVRISDAAPNMPDFSNHCFVCGREVDPQLTERNHQLNLPVCSDCAGTDAEKKAIDELNEGLAEGFVCGCI
jgi:hypothetical protein